VKARRDEYTDATRAALLRAARRRFGREGFAGAGLEQIAAEARVTTGAIYHHFGSKKGLFQAVAEAVEAELLEVATAPGPPDRWQALQAALERLVDACAQADVQRIVFREAPQVLGLEAWRKIEAKYGYGVLDQTLGRLMADGRIRRYPLGLITPVVLGVLFECSRAVAEADDRDAARADASDLISRVLDALAV
jgi:AcrR family transcriptional regulator